MWKDEANPVSTFLNNLAGQEGNGLQEPERAQLLQVARTVDDLVCRSRMADRLVLDNVLTRAALEELHREVQDVAELARTPDVDTDPQVILERAQAQLERLAGRPTQPLPQPSPAVQQLETLLVFLYGAGPLEGRWFGDDPPRGEGRFWWRRHLPPYLRSPVVAEPVDTGDVDVGHRPGRAL